MFYTLPKKNQMHQSQANWRIESSHSVLVLVGLDQLKQCCTQALNGSLHHSLFDHFTLLLKKATSLDIPVIHLNHDQNMTGMQRLGEYFAQNSQLMIAGDITASFKQVVQHIATVSNRICLIDDAICLENQAQHITWINKCVEMGLHHMNTQTLLRLWSLSAPKELILSSKGIIFAIAEQLNLEAMQINPTVNLKDYGLDSVSIVELVGLWRANGANIRYEDFTGHVSLEKIMAILYA